MNENINEKEMSGNTDVNNIDMQLFLEKCRQGTVDENSIPKEILSLFEKMYAEKKQKEMDTQNSKSMQNTQNIQQGLSYPYIEGLTLEDIKYINDYAVKQTERYTNEKFDMSNLAHREYFEYFKQQLLKSKENEIKLRKFEKGMQEKYGSMYPQVESAARNAFENMAYRDARNIILSRMKGDIDSLITFYDNIYKGMQSEKGSAQAKENMIFPPKAVKGGNYANNGRKQTAYENFI